MEEEVISINIMTAKEGLIAAEKELKLAQQKANAAKKKLEDATQAGIEYMTTNGLTECEQFKLTRSYRVDVADIDAVPDEYIRVKTTKEVDKAKIRATRPAGNFYVMSEHLGISFDV